MKRHQPKHIYIDNQTYFITSHLFDRKFLFDSATKKDKLLLKLFSFAWEERIELRAWVVLNNHYHVLLKVSDGHSISNYMGRIHSGLTFEMNEQEGMKGRRLWKNYWDWCIRDEADYWRHFNYIHHNPIKHGIVGEMVHLGGYRYSSYWNYLRKKGSQWLRSVMEDYPILDFIVENDG